MTNSVVRSIVKTASYGLLSTIATVLIVLIFTESLAIAGLIGGVDRIVKLLLYFFHERAWNATTFGREEKT